jgi:hypothetical protein
VLINSEAGRPVRWGGHGEGLRRSHGDAVGVKAGASLIERFQVNVGTAHGRPSPGIRPGWGAGPLPTGGRWAGRRSRSSPSTREACTWRRGPASRQGGRWNARRTPVNTDEPELALYRAERRVREIQTKLHRLRDGACGAPGARRRARRVREAARGNPPVETPAGRPGSTSLPCPMCGRAPTGGVVGQRPARQERPRPQK